MTNLAFAQMFFVSELLAITTLCLSCSVARYDAPFVDSSRRLQEMGFMLQPAHYKSAMGTRLCSQRCGEL